MLSVVIVEDEYLIRRMICQSIDWHSLNLEIAGEAKDGAAAIDLIRQLQPDIVLLDINIPIVNGLAVIRSAQTEGLSTRFIVVSGYTDFYYAHEALNLGVSTYIVKPIITDDLIAALIKIRDEIIQNHAFHTQLEKMKSKQNNLQFDLMLSQIIHGDYPADAERIRMLRQQNSFLSSIEHYVLGCGRISQGECHSIQQTEIWNQLLNDAVSSKLSFRQAFYLFFTPQAELLLLMGASGLTGEDIEDIINLFIGKSREALDMDLTMGVSHIKASLSQLSEAYLEAKQALESSFSLGNNRAILYESNNPDERSTGTQIFAVDSAKVTRMMRSGNFDAVIDYIERAYSNVHMWGQTTFLSVQMLSILSEFCSDRKINLIQSETSMQDLMQMQTYEEMKSYILNAYNGVMRHLNTSNVSSSGRTVRIALSYIEAHLNDPELSLSSISSGIFVNASYLSHIFAQQMGVSISNYICNIRLDHAKQLCDSHTDLSTDALAMTVGFKDMEYFNRCFKRKFGLTVRQYRNQIPLDK